MKLKEKEDNKSTTPTSIIPKEDPPSSVIKEDVYSSAYLD